MDERTSGQLREWMELTERDVVLAFLLALDELLQPGAEDQWAAQLSPRSLQERERAQLLFDLTRHCLGSIADPQEFGKHYGYGLPDWLIAGPKAPLFFLLECVTSARDQWETLSKRFRDNDLLNELNELHESLLAPPVAPPVQAFRELRDEVMITERDAAPVIATTAIAARASARRGIRETHALARRAMRLPGIRARDGRIEELSWRVVRFDFPLVVSRGRKCGVLIGAELSFEGGRTRATLKEFDRVVELLDPDEILKSLRWKPCTDEFSMALQRAATAATELLVTLGMTRGDLEQFRRPQLLLRGVFPPVMVSGASIGLPLALEILRHALDLPPSDWIASGAIDESGCIEPLEPETLRAKWQAVRDDGLARGLLAAGSTDDAIPDDQICLLDADRRTLFYAAAALWGEEWKRKVRHIQADSLRAAGFSRGWRDHPGFAKVSDVEVIVETEQARSIVTFFRERGPEFAFLAGRSKTGKTCMAQQVQKSLEATGEWDVDVLSMLPGAQPDVDDIVAATRRLLSLPSHKKRRLIVLDGIEWNEKLGEFEYVLRGEALQAGVSILAVARSDLSTDWVSGDCTPFRPEAISNVLNEVFARFPQMEKAKDLSGTVLRYARGDLWWTLNLLALSTQTEGSPTYQELVQTFLKSRLQVRSQSELDLLQRVATLSLFSAHVPESQVPDALHANLGTIGARLVPRRGWTISSRATCDGLLSAFLKDGELTLYLESAGRLSPQHVEAVISGAISRDDSIAPIIILSQLRQFSPATLTRVWRLMKDRLPAWAQGIADPVQLAMLLEVLSAFLNDSDLRRLVYRLAELVSIELNRLDPHDLATCIRVLRRERAFTEESDKESRRRGPVPWDTLMNELEDTGLGKVLERNATTIDKLFLLEELWRTHDDRAHHALAKHARRFVPDSPPYAAHDYRLALRLFDVTANIATLWETPESKHASRHAKLACESIANWEFPPESRPTSDQILLRLGLRQALHLEAEDWTIVATGAEKDLRNSISRSTLSQLCAGLTSLAEVNRPFAVRLLNTVKISEQLSRRTFSAGEVATLLGTVNNLHTDTAYRLLYESSGAPRRIFARRLADSIKSTGDAKGAGRLIYAASKIDELFGTMSGGFARLLADSIGTGFLRETLKKEIQVSVLFHLIQGFAAIDLPFADDTWDLVCNVVVETVKESVRPWAPQLALQMCEAKDTGARFAKKFADSVAATEVLTAMANAYDIDALESFHHLGRLYPALPRHFGDSFDPGTDLPRLSREDRPDVVLRAIRATGDTLRRAGWVRPEREMLNRLDKQAKVAALRRSPPGDVATTIHLWRQIDPSDAAEMVRWDAAEEILLHKLRRTITEPHLGVDLLVAVEQAAPGAGSALMQKFRKQEGPWTGFVNEIAYDQNPVTQSRAFLDLCRLGFQPDDRQCSNIYKKVWQPRIGIIASPTALASLLKSFAAWDMQWGIEAAGMVDIHRVARRIRSGSSADLNRVAELIGSLHALEQHDGARRLAEELGQITRIEHDISLEAWQSLLPVLSIVHPALASDVGARLATLLESATGSNYDTRDDQEVWRTVGWLAFHCLSSSGYRARIAQPPASFSIPKDPGTRLWATAWLADAPWVSTERTLAWQHLFRNPRTCANAMRVPALVAMASIGHLDKIVNQVGVSWCDGSLGHPGLLLAVMKAGLSADFLAGWTVRRCNEIRHELDRPHHRGNLFAVEARRVLNAIISRSPPAAA